MRKSRSVKTGPTFNKPKQDKKKMVMTDEIIIYVLGFEQKQWKSNTQDLTRRTIVPLLVVFLELLIKKII